MSDEMDEVEESADREAMNERMLDALVPGFEVEFDPGAAEKAGAFNEDALSEEDARESAVDVIESTSQPELRQQRVARLS